MLSSALNYNPTFYPCKVFHHPRPLQEGALKCRWPAADCINYYRTGGVTRDISIDYDLWRRGLVVDTWLWDQEVPGSSPGCARSTLSPWERLFTCIGSPHSCVKRVRNYMQYP